MAAITGKDLEVVSEDPRVKAETGDFSPARVIFP